MSMIFDFENADIGKLAIHLARARVPIAPIPVSVPGQFSTPALAFGERCLFYGMAAGDESAAANLVQAAQGPGSPAVLLGTLNLAANGEGTLWLGQPGIYVDAGVYLSATGPAVATVFVLPCRWYE